MDHDRTGSSRNRTLEGMSRLLPRARAARPFLRRGRDRVQAGLDPERVVVVEGLTDIASSALLHLDGGAARHDVLRLAPELAAVLDALHERGVLDDDPDGSGLSAHWRARLAPDIAALAVAGSSTAHAQRVLARRRRTAVAVRGNDQAAAQVAVGLAGAGLGVVALEGPDRLTGVTDVPPVTEPHVSWREEVGAVVRRLGAHPTPTATRGRGPAVVVISAAADVDLPWTDPELADDLLADGVPHLPVAVTAEAARVGPLVIPGRTACLWCLELSARDRDAAWPALVDQVRLRHAVARAHTGVLTVSAATLAVAQVLHLLDTGDECAPVTATAQIEVGTPDGLTRVLPVQRHPACGCGWAGNDDTMAG